VRDDATIGGLHNGWAVANTTLMHERSGLGAGGHSAAAAASAGTIAGDLPKRAGDFVRPSGPSGGGGGGGAMAGGAVKLFIDGQGQRHDRRPTIRQDLMKLHTLHEIGRMQPCASRREAGGSRHPRHGQHRQAVDERDHAPEPRPGPAPRRRRRHAARLQRDDRKALDAATGNPFLAYVTEMGLFAQGPPIYGGTDQIQRNIIGERVLGLPKEPNNDRVKTWAELPKNG
jgi:hypothetical protein